MKRKPWVTIFCLYLWTKKCKSIEFMTQRMDVFNKCALLRDDICSPRAENKKKSATEPLRDHVVFAQKEREFLLGQRCKNLLDNVARFCLDNKAAFIECLGQY